MKHGNESFLFNEGLINEPLFPKELFDQRNELCSIFPYDLPPKPDEQVPKPTRKFCRLFSKGEQPNAQGLIELGLSMEIERPEDTNNNLDSDIPAGYTYLGQFIDHDITLDRNTKLTEDGQTEPCDMENFRTPSLDLDSLYLDGPEKNPELYNSDRRTFKIGKTQKIKDVKKEFYNDLLRQAFPNKLAIIGDDRNDENLTVAQTHLAFLKFHNALAAECPEKCFRDLRHEATLHYQAIILTDFLPQILDKEVLNDVLQNGRKFYTDDKKNCIPIEFSVAAYRMGHSMVRPKYSFNRFHDKATLKDFFEFSGRSGSLNGLFRLQSDWIIDWRRFYKLCEGMQLNYTRKLNTHMASKLKELPQFEKMISQVPDAFLSLATRNLLRGRLVSLPSGQQVACKAGEIPLTPDEILLNLAEDQAGILRNHKFHESTPLWYYFLREAMVQANGNHLGKVGSRIVAETFIGLIQNSSINVINKQPELRFSMSELLKKIPNDINPLGD